MWSVYLPYTKAPGGLCCLIVKYVHTGPQMTAYMDHRKLTLYWGSHFIEVVLWKSSGWFSWVETQPCCLVLTCSSLGPLENKSACHKRSYHWNVCRKTQQSRDPSEVRQNEAVAWRKIQSLPGINPEDQSLSVRAPWSWWERNVQASWVARKKRDRSPQIGWISTPSKQRESWSINKEYVLLCMEHMPGAGEKLLPYIPTFHPCNYPLIWIRTSK